MFPQDAFELLCAAAVREGSFTVSVSPTRVRASFKCDGKRRQTVNSMYDADVRGCLVELAKQCDWFAQVRFEKGRTPTTAEFVERLTPHQRTRLQALLQNLRDFKEEVLSGVNVAKVEPVLAEPRSSLNPLHLADADHDVDSSERPQNERRPPRFSKYAGETQEQFAERRRQYRREYRARRKAAREAQP